MVLDNDARGWIMTVVSGIACTFGASIICVDLIIRQFPGKKNFKIEDSNTFLSMGLSLSFGVMIFSSLYSMLPSAKKFLIDGGQTPRNAILVMISCFLVGAFGISVLSRILHSYIPHSVVDCDHEHGQGEEGKIEDEEAGHSNRSIHEQQRAPPFTDGHHDGDVHRSYGTQSEMSHGGSLQRPSLQSSISSKVTQLVTGAKNECDDNGECFGYSDTCSTECFKNVLQTRPARLQARKSLGNLITARPASMNRNQTTQVNNGERRLLLPYDDETTPLMLLPSGPATMDHSTTSLLPTNGHTNNLNHTHTSRPQSIHKHSRSSSRSSSTTSTTSSSTSHDHSPDDLSASQHHHHVPNNVFLSLGLQTSCAIALHKIPEGFITYATNHANPTLGVSIFLALFIHNITEGFALALPLYLAINSRWKAMLWSTLLGGVSQPLGAAVAALWFSLAGRTGGSQPDRDGPDEIVYGCMFACTAGIMAMVSLQLLAESLDLTHSKRLCFFSAFAGMGILGLSSALTA